MRQHLGVAALTELWSLIKGSFARKVAAAPASTTVDIQLQTEGAQTLNTATIPAATTTTAGVFTAADKAKLDGFDSASTYAKKGTTLGGYGITDAYTKAQTDSAISNAVSGLYRYKGSVASADKLPASPATGDVYNIETASTYGAAGANVAWNGSAWDSLGEVFSITAIKLVTTVTDGNLEISIA